jgi:enamine deaminase RidA (YjgF/YER057c/UK114 family)
VRYWGQNPVKSSQVDPGLGHQGEEPGDDVQDALMSQAQDAQERLKSSGSKMTCVVPLRYGVVSS